jgi:ABC-type multidrug transport system permease subunit
MYYALYNQSLKYHYQLEGGIILEALSILIYIIPAVILFLIIFYAVKFAILEAHREIEEKSKKVVEETKSL